MSGSSLARIPGATAGPLRWALRLLLAGPGRMRPWGRLTASALTAAGAVSVHTGLLGYRESLAVPYARSSLVVEFAGAAILVLAAVVVASAAHGREEPGR